MVSTNSSNLIGVWEQVGYLHPLTGVPLPWPDGSLNASVREFFGFLEDGTFVFGRFDRAASVVFDDRKREFVCDGRVDTIHRGKWRHEGNSLIEEIALEDLPPTTNVVELGEVNDDRFVVNERTPGLDFVLQVVYQKVKSLAGESPSAADSGPAEPEAQDDIEEMMSTLYRLACPLVAQGSFQPIGISMSNAGDLAVQYVAHGGSGMEVRKQLHRILVEKAASGQVRGVAICHSLQNELGSFLVVGADHARGRPTTILYPLEDTRDGTRVSGEPIQQRAAYTFFKYVQPGAARHHLPGRWFKESGGQNWLTCITYRTDGTFESTAGGGHWRIEPGDFFTQLFEEFNARAGLGRVSRFVSLDEHRLELSEVVGGLVSSAVYVRYEYTDEKNEKRKPRPWWRFW